ncbi:MAG: ATP-grasp domain-containing protein [Coriobacteriia bacterium]|nr:ATP-grasp domain-containing protein [Coriobacteriia bacterium]
MFILEEPYVSELLASTVAESGVPVLDTRMARLALAGRGVALSDDAAFAAAAARPGARIYANSENAIGWIAEHLGGTDLPRRIRLFKDKVAFRELVADMYPEYRFTGVPFAELRSFDPSVVRAPFVIKPAVGFFSVGVHVVGSYDEWPGVLTRVEREVAAQRQMYPEQVLDLDRFVIEEVIDGEEFAVDAYFDSAGKPVLVNVLAHRFASADDVSDRVYYTSVEVIERLGAPAMEFLTEVGKRADLRDFPVHAELRIDAAGSVAPIEINPMRFGGWCATDLAHFAYGVNPYRCYLEGTCPDWDAIARERGGRVTAMIVADLPASVDRARIAAVDLEGFTSRFSHVLEVRPTDVRRYGVFAFTFVDVRTGDTSELDEVLGEDLSRYVTME